MAVNVSAPGYSTQKHLFQQQTCYQVWNALFCSRDDAALNLPGLRSLWSVANAVTSAVKQSADEVVKSVKQTDWKSEFAAFTQEVEAEAQKASQKAVEASQKAVVVVQQLPQQIQHTAQQAEVKCIWEAVQHGHQGRVAVSTCICCVCSSSSARCLMLLQHAHIAAEAASLLRVAQWQRHLCQLANTSLQPLVPACAATHTAHQPLTPWRMHHTRSNTKNMVCWPDGILQGGPLPAAAAGGSAATQLGGVGASLVEFGKQLISGTKEVLETVRGSMARQQLCASVEHMPFCNKQAVAEPACAVGILGTGVSASVHVYVVCKYGCRLQHTAHAYALHATG